MAVEEKGNSRRMREKQRGENGGWREGKDVALKYTRGEGGSC